MLPRIRLKKGEDRRIRAGHPWIFSNEIDNKITPLKSFAKGSEVVIETNEGAFLGVAYVNPHSLIACRLISRIPNERLDLNFLVKKIQQALYLRETLFVAPFYRLVYAEADGLPGLIIDRFANDFVVQINTAGMEQKSEWIIQALCQLFPVHSILFRNDSSIRQQENLETYVQPAYGTPPEDIHLEENSIQFITALLKGQKTGWFYDHRYNRAKLKTYVPHKNVLDVFSYVGSFGIHAAVFGAKRVDCIEASSFAAAYIQKNAELNNVSSKVNIFCEDAFEAMKHLLHEQQHYDVIILDPPAFVKKSKDRKEGLIAYQRLSELALKLLNPTGILVSCSCSMHITKEDLLAVSQRAASRCNTSLQLLEQGHQGPDHPIHPAVPETDYLKALFLRKL